MSLERPTIPPYDYLAKMPPNTADLDERWAFLSAGIDRIMNDSQTGLSVAEYANLYTTIFTYITASGSSEGNGQAGSNLYKRLNECFIPHVKGLFQKTELLSDMELLQYYAVEWDRYKTSARYLDRLFTFLNREYVKHVHEREWKTVFPVYTLALLQWKEHFFLPVQKDNARLTTIILSLLTAQRNGETINFRAVNNVVVSFASLGVPQPDRTTESLDLYRDQIETTFIHAEEAFFKKELFVFSADKTISYVIKKAEQHLREAENRVELCLHTSTRQKLMENCLNILIREYGTVIWGWFRNLFDPEKDEDLQRMCFISQTTKGLIPLNKWFEAHVKQAGLASISKLVDEAGGVNSLDPKAYVDALLEVHQKNSNVVNKIADGHVKFAASLDKSCQEFINRNAATGTSSTKSSELIVRHVDLLLRKNNKMSEDEVEAALNHIMILFKYLEDKDVFQMFYTNKISKRLIHGVSASDTSEASMISKLKEACGFDYTVKLQRMFSDASLSEDLTRAFKDHMARTHDGSDVTFSIMVLGSNIWPLSPPSHDFVIPIEILDTYNRFQKYYQTKHSGRKLIWLWNYSKNELRTNYLNQKYILVTSSYQMAVLLQYNQNNTISLDELVSATSIPRDILIQVLSPLVKAKILINEEAEQYDLNPKFKSKKIRVNLNLPIKESVNIPPAITEDRKYYIQATIVRIMKARQTMGNQALIQEVVSHLSQRFVPSISSIKKEIDNLLEKEYIKRSEDSTDTFEYIA